MAVAQPDARNAKVTATTTVNALATSSAFSAQPRRRLSLVVQVRDTTLGQLDWATGTIATIRILVSTKKAFFSNL